MSDWLRHILGPDWQAYLVYIGAATIFVTGIGWGLWKGNGDE